MRIDSACNFGQLERLYQDRLRLVLGADNLDDLVEVKIGDQIAAEHFETMLDLLEPVIGAAHQHVAQMIEPCPQRFGETNDLRHAAVDQHIHVKRNAAFKLGQFEQRFHQQSGVDRSRARLDDKANVFRRLVTNVRHQRQLLFVQQFGEPLHQPRLLHHVGNFRDDDLVGAATGFFRFPARAHAKRSAPRRIGFRNRIARIDDDAAGGKIRTGNVFQKRLAARIRIIDQEQRGVA